MAARQGLPGSLAARVSYLLEPKNWLIVTVILIGGWWAAASSARRRLCSPTRPWPDQAIVRLCACALVRVTGE
jgi:hypothetical protein